MAEDELITIDTFTFCLKDFHSTGIARIDDRTPKLRAEMEAGKIEWPEGKWPLHITLFLRQSDAAPLFKMNFRDEVGDLETIDMYIQLLIDIGWATGKDLEDLRAYNRKLRKQFGLLVESENSPDGSPGKGGPSHDVDIAT